MTTNPFELRFSSRARAENKREWVKQARALVECARLVADLAAAENLTEIVKIRQGLGDGRADRK